MSSELKSCPFCGGGKVTVKQDTILICGHRYWFIEHTKPSDKCALVDGFDRWRSILYSTEGKAIEAWNRRASE